MKYLKLLEFVRGCAKLNFTDAELQVHFSHENSHLIVTDAHKSALSSRAILKKKDHPILEDMAGQLAILVHIFKQFSEK